MRALQTLSRFAKPTRWTLVAWAPLDKNSTPPIPSPLVIKPALPRPRSSYSDHLSGFLLKLWRLVTSTIRIGTYPGLASLGSAPLRPISSLQARWLPFRMYLKAADRDRRGIHENEYAALGLVRHYTNIPVPRPRTMVRNYSVLPPDVQTPWRAPKGRALTCSLTVTRGTCYGTCASASSSNGLYQTSGGTRVHHQKCRRQSML